MIEIKFTINVLHLNYPKIIPLSRSVGGKKNVFCEPGSQCQKCWGLLVYKLENYHNSSIFTSVTVCIVACVLFLLCGMVVLLPYKPSFSSFPNLANCFLKTQFTHHLIQNPSTFWIVLIVPSLYLDCLSCIAFGTLICNHLVFSPSSVNSPDIGGTYFISVSPVLNSVLETAVACFFFFFLLFWLYK